MTGSALDTVLAAAAEAARPLADRSAADPATDDAVTPRLIRELTDRAGRIVFSGWPTGVSVTAAMHHGGPYPATTAPLHTSVGPAAIDRFLRPVVFQNVPQNALPPAWRTAHPTVQEGAA